MSMVQMITPPNYSGVLVGPSKTQYSVQPGQTINVDARDVSFALARGFISAPSGSALLNMTTVALTSAQLLALFSDPVVVVPAQGAGTLIMPVSVICTLYFGTAPYVTTDDTIGLFWNGPTTGDPATTANTGTFQASSNQFWILLPSATNGAPADVNEPLLLSSQAADMTGGDGTGSVTVVWATVDVNL